MNNYEWSHKDEWQKSGKGFTVTIERWSHGTPEVNIWNVHAYVRKGHGLFDSFVGDGMRQNAATFLPLHGGPTLLQWHGEGTVVQVGCDYGHCDYGHYREERFKSFATAEQAHEVFADAEKLFAHLIGEKA